ncbi:MAG: AraC family transcriptional regulator ligand-binding domain-containing protein [Burkholderiales bacterium]|nr:AraC family transcriptional regulator ligand-binding domain-containing protein [Burkholderiales bacterium]
MSKTSHFAPAVNQAAPLCSTPVISVTALAGVPAWVRHTLGDRAQRTASKAAMLDIEVIEDEDCFIPHRTMTTYLDAVARNAGAQDLGLLLTPGLSLDRYGCWGRYALAAPTLGAAVERARATVAFHSKGDAVALDARAGRARVSYVSAARGLPGYRHVACGSAAVIVSLCRAFLSESWRPQAIELDIAAPRRGERFEEIFGCPVRFDASRVSVWLDTQQLHERPADRPPPPLITVEDLARARIDCRRLQRVTDIVAQQVWAQVQGGAVSIDSAAASLATSVRSLQRALNREGTDFRSLANALRGRRAIELLSRTDASVAQVAATLGYSVPAHFARAFRKATGLGPTEFRRRRSVARHGTLPSAPHLPRSEELEDRLDATDETLAPGDRVRGRTVPKG